MNKKMILLILLMLCMGIIAIYGQENNDVEIEYIYDVSDDAVVSRFDSSLPENGVNNVTLSDIQTEEEFIFKTFIMEKLLKSNRILY